MKKLTNIPFWIAAPIGAIVLFFLSGCAIERAGSVEEMTLIEYIFSTTRAERTEYGFRAFSNLHGAIDTWFIIILPLLVSLPFLYPFEEAISGGFYRFQVSRWNYRKFIFKSQLQNSLIGASAVTAGYAVFAVIIYMLFPRYSQIVYGDGSAVEYRDGLFGINNEAFGLLLRFAIFFVFAMIVAELCMLTTLVTMNKFKAIGIPMTLFYLMDRISYILLCRDFDERYSALSPSMIMSSSENWFSSFNISSAWLFVGLAAIYAVLFAASSVIMKRRIAF